MRSNNPEVRKHGLEKTLEGKAFELEMGTPEWKATIARRVLIKNLKQKLAYGVGSIPMFKLLQEIRIAKCQNPQVQIPLNPSLYFGISLPAFVTLHRVEGVTNPILKLLKQPSTSMNMQGTMVVPSEITFSDVLREAKLEEYFTDLQKTHERVEKAYNRMKNK